MSASDHFISQSLCVLTVSDTRTAANDASGDYLCASLTEAGHRLHERRLARDDRYLVRAIVAAWIADPAVDGILVTGGTGFLGRRIVSELSPRHALRLLVRRGSSRERFPEGVEFAEGDVTDRASLDRETALGILREGGGTEFHPALLDNFLRLVT